jgi:hypothetical protein
MPFRRPHCGASVMEKLEFPSVTVELYNKPSTQMRNRHWLSSAGIVGTYMHGRQSITDCVLPAAGWSYACTSCFPEPARACMILFTGRSIHSAVMLLVPGVILHGT